MGLNWNQLGRLTNLQAYYDYLEDLDYNTHFGNKDKFLPKVKPFCHNCGDTFSNGKQRNKHIKDQECL